MVVEEDLVDKAIPTPMKYKNKWALTILCDEWQTAQKVQVPVFCSSVCFFVSFEKSYQCLKWIPEHV